MPLLQALRVWDPGQKPASLLEEAWLQLVQLNFPPLAAAVNDELLEFLTHVKELFLERPSIAHLHSKSGTHPDAILHVQVLHAANLCLVPRGYH